MDSEDCLVSGVALTREGAKAETGRDTIAEEGAKKVQ
jgi:hypothetical protein